MKSKKIALVFVVLILSSFAQSNNSVGPLIQNDWATFTWPYNAYFPESSSGVNGHIGNACGHTTIARILNYYGYPVNGTKVLDFTDYFGNEWYCDLTDMNLNYTAMPYHLDWDAPESEYKETAKLFLAAAAVGEKIEIGFRDGHLKVPGALEEYFNFSSNWLILNRWEFSREEWIEIFKFELDNGRPILVVGRTPDSPAPWEPGGWQGHWWICDGYNSDDEFYVNYSFGGIKDYFDIDNLGGIYTAYNTIIVGLEPDLDGKFMSVTSPTSGNTFELNEEIPIEWQSNNVDEIKISLSIDDGWTWQEIALNVPASSGSYTWTSEDIISSDCLIKLTDSKDDNIYTNSNVFIITDNKTEVNDDIINIPTEFALHQNFPNPFNPSTTIYYSIPKESYVEIKIYDKLGRRVETLLAKSQFAGKHQIEFNANSLSSGVYFYTLRYGNNIQTRKMILLR